MDSIVGFLMIVAAIIVILIVGYLILPIKSSKKVPKIVTVLALFLVLLNLFLLIDSDPGAEDISGLIFVINIFVDIINIAIVWSIYFISKSILLTKDKDESNTDIKSNKISIIKSILFVIIIIMFCLIFMIL